MKYVKIEGGVPTRYSVKEAKQEALPTVLPRQPTDEMLAEYNIFPLREDKQPAYDPNTQRLIKNDPQEIAGEWRVTWTVEDLTTAEIDAQVEKDVDRAIGVSDADKALGLVMADMWLNITTGKNPPGVGPVQNQATQQQMQTARQQVRSRLEAYIRDLKGL